jgi:hypothetical protein
MEETTSWKNHTFTLLIFGGIIVLCSIFFTLGMVVGRSQGRQLAETDFQERENKKSPAEVAGDNFQLNYFDETTGDNPDLTLKPTPPRPAAPHRARKRRLPHQSRRLFERRHPRHHRSHLPPRRQPGTCRSQPRGVISKQMRN